MRRSRLIPLAASLLLVGAMTAGAAFKLASSGQDMTTAAQKWIATLSADEKAKGVMPYDAPQRVDWHFIPKATRKGIQIREMNATQRQAALGLLQSSLSAVGYGKATKIMELEKLLKELEKAKTNTPLRDNERYYFTVFGEPTPSGKWGLSIEGHHMSFNFVVEGGKVVSSTPQMFGANPATVKASDIAGIPAGLRLLAKEEQLAFDLLGTLTSEQRKAAVIAEKALEEVRTAGAPEPPKDPAVGLPSAQLNDAQKKILKDLVVAYAENMPADVAQDRLSSIDFDKLHFAWAGAGKPGVGHYYRIQGATFIIEFVNTQPDAAGNPANHIHCTWRDARGDFAIPIK